MPRRTTWTRCAPPWDSRRWTCPAGRSAGLLGVVPTDAAMPLHLARDSERALHGVVADCEAETACRAAFPRLRADLRRSLERLAGGPVEVEVASPATGRPVRIALTRD